MKTLFLSQQGISPIFQAMEAELIELAIERGEEVWTLFCKGDLLSCRFNPTHNIIGCAVCSSRCSQVMDLLGVPPERRLSLDPSLFPEELPVPLPADLKGLLDFTIEGVNVGRGAASTTISFLRDYDLQIKGKHQELIDLQVRNALGAARNYRKVLEEIQPDKVIIRNGRHVQSNPMVDLCQKMGIPFDTYETGAKMSGYQFFDNALPHSIVTRQRIMDKLWAQMDSKQRVKQAENWFEAKRQGVNTEDKVYIKDQQKNVLPNGFDFTRHNIVIFNSSEDEMKTILEWRTPLYDSQNEAIRMMMEAAASRENVQLYLRVHPNLARLNSLQLREIAAFPENKIKVIGALETVDTYALLDAADVVVTFGSSVGIEATYWQRPSVLYGHSFYEGRDAVYQPTSKEEFLELIFKTDLSPKKKENTYPYAIFVNNFGTPYKRVNVVNEHEAYVKGKPLRRFTLRSLFNFIRLLPQIGNWFRRHRIFMDRKLRLGDILSVHNRREH